MNLDRLVAYPVAGKRKSRDICAAFVRSQGGLIAVRGSLDLKAVSVFYGVDDSNAEVWRAVNKAGLPFVYIDNSYFDAARGWQYRATLNRLQHAGDGQSTGERLAALGVDILPPKTDGLYWLEVEQSPLFMRHIGRYGADWCNDVLRLRGEDRVPRRRRAWSANKPGLAESFASDLASAACVVTHSSAAAVEAVLAGARVVTSLHSAAWRFARYPTPGILPDADDRRRWAAVLADNQWTLDEFASGKAWEGVKRGQVVV